LSRADKEIFAHVRSSCGHRRHQGSSLGPGSTKETATIGRTQPRTIKEGATELSDAWNLRNCLRLVVTI